MMATRTAKGMRRDQSIIDELARKPQTTADLAEILGCCASNVSVCIMRLMKESPRRIHISGHKSNVGKWAGRPAAIYSAGDAPDVEFVPLNISTRKQSAEDRQNKTIELLKKKRMTSTELSNAMYLTRATILNHLSALKKTGKVYIAYYRHPKEVNPDCRGGAWSPVYAVGNKEDAPAPKQKTSAERHAEMYQSPAYREQEKKRRRLRYLVEKSRKKPNTIFGALFA